MDFLLKRISLLVMATLLLTACGGGDKKEDPKPEPDNIKPTIETTLPAATGQAYGLGGTFAYKGTFTDNEELKQVVFSLSDNKQVPGASLKGATSVDGPPWEPDDFIVQLNDKSQTLDENLFGGIPNDANMWTDGTYTLTITCTDKAGNTATASIDVTIQ